MIYLDLIAHIIYLIVIQVCFGSNIAFMTMISKILKKYDALKYENSKLKDLLDNVN